MTVLNEKDRNLEHIISAADHYHTTEGETVAPGDGVTYEPGTVLGKITASGKCVIYNPGNSDGSETVYGVLRERIIGTADAIEGRRAVDVRGPMQVKKSKLKWFSGANAGQITTGEAALEGLGIIVREEV